MKALITGAEGFVGRHLTDHLVACGDTVIGVDRGNGPDLLDPSGLDDLLTETSPDVVYHLAGWSDIGASWKHPRTAFEVNATGTLNLLQACIAHGRPRVLAVSSADVYGTVTPAELPLTENSPFRPVTPYAASKVAADQLALQAWLGFELEVIRVRAFNHLGPGQSTNFVAPAIADRIARNEREQRGEVAVGDLTPRRDITDVRDVVRAYRLLIEHGGAGEAYNVCTGRDHSIEAIAEMLISLASIPMRLVPDPDLLRPVEIPVLRGDPSKLQAATGWSPEIDLRDTVADVLADRRQHVN
jgi:GDP-4-dehydro-6-deoxy-D-mannose reductase